ncbi:MAG: hypothetical protein R2800_03450 [Flavipsychrobacter sp.]
MKYASLLVATISLSIFLISCSKNKTEPANNNGSNNNNQSTLNDNEKYLLGKWRLKTIVDSNYDHTTLQGVYEGVKDCRKDDVYTFLENRKYIKDEGVDTCTKGLLYTEKDWKVSGDPASLYYSSSDAPTIYPSSGSAPFAFFIEDDNTFKVRGTYYFSASNQGVLIFYYQRL